MFTTYNKITGQVLAIREGQGDGAHLESDTIGVIEAKVPSSMYVNPATGLLEERVPAAISFSVAEALAGTVVQIQGVPEDAHLMFRGEVTQDREFTMANRDILVSLIGKYEGAAVCGRLTEDMLVERELRELMRERLRTRQAT